MPEPFLDFDVDPTDERGVLNLVRTAYDIADDHQNVRDAQCERDYQNFHGFVDMSARDPDRANISIPKLNSVLMTGAPKEIKALTYKRPYIPLIANLDEFKPHARLNEKILDTLLYRGGFRHQFALAIIMKMLYGTAYMEVVPVYKRRIEKMMVDETIPAMDGSPVVIGRHVEDVEVNRLHFKIAAYAPWQVKVDPFAVSLEDEDGCRYVVKIQIVSKRLLRKMAMEGAYGPNFDVEKLNSSKADYTEAQKDRGLEILTNMGMPEPRVDGDIGVMMRLETAERYTDVWNDRIILRDGVNPYIETPGTNPRRRGHGLINLSRLIHNIDPHTQTQFWGNGEAKIIEILTMLLSDHYNLAFDNANFLNQGMTYALKSGGLTPESLIHAVGNKVLIDPLPGLGIKDMVMESFGENLPRDFYALGDKIDQFIDLVTHKAEPTRGQKVTGEHTLGEVIRMEQKGDARDELTVSFSENPGLSDIAFKCLGHIEQFAKEDDIVDLLGEEEAAQFLYLHPRYMPGGYDYKFKGSDHVMNDVMKQQSVAALSEQLIQNPYLKPREWGRLQLEVSGFDDEVDNVLFTEEEFAQIQQQQAEQEIQREEMSQEIETEGKAQQEAVKAEGKLRQEVVKAALAPKEKPAPKTKAASK
jgi:hypothetical protein